MTKQVAQDIVAYCTSCRMDLVHTIEAIEGSRIVRVHCKTCKKQHSYKPPKGVKEPTAEEPPKRPAPRKKTVRENPADEWQKIMEVRDEEPSKPYFIKGAFEEGDKIHHPKFGIGWVKRLIDTNKMEVLFEGEIKIMVRGESPRA